LNGSISCAMADLLSAEAPAHYGTTKAKATPVFDGPFHSAVDPGHPVAAQP
jgi:hypothetical protein